MEVLLSKQARLLDGITPIIDFYPEALHEEFTSDLRVLKTTKRKFQTMEYGDFIARVIHFYDPAEKWEDIHNKRIKKYTSNKFQDMVRGKMRFSLDIMYQVGQLRFLENKSRDEIQKTLFKEYNIRMSTGTISNYSLEFLIRFKMHHDRYFHQLVNEMNTKGGYILGADGTGDGGSDRILLLIDLLTGWTLSADAIPTEKSDYIIPIFQVLIEKAGLPLAFVRDLGKGLSKAGDKLFSTIPIKGCNFHFLRDVGKDIMETNYLEFRRTIITLKIRPNLTKLRKSLNQEALLKGINLRETMLSLKQSPTAKDINVEHIILVETYHLISWILNYKEMAQGLRFPYSLPWLYLYQRCRSAKELLSEIVNTANKAKLKPLYLKKLKEIIGCLFQHTFTNTKDNLRKIFKDLEKQLLKDQYLFSELRRILRLSRDKGDIPRDQLLLSDEEVTKVEEELTQFKENLSLLIKEQDENTRSSEKIIIEHINRYWNQLIVPNLTVTVNGEKKTVAIPRAISRADSRFSKVKSSIRKRTGRKDTANELNRYGIHLCYIQNLYSSEYVKVLFGSIEEIPDVLGSLSKKEVDKAIAEFKTAQCRYDITNARGEGELEEFQTLITQISKKADLISV